MVDRNRLSRALISGAAVMLVLFFVGTPVRAQRGGFGGAGRGGPPPTAREAAPVDLTGYWVAQVTEDWIERMTPDSPPSGTGGGFGGGGDDPGPAANPDDPCRVYGAGGGMRVPGRLHVTWADDETLQIEMSAGNQTRTLNFNPEGALPAARSLQGYSVASWQVPAAGGRGRGGGAPPDWGSLRVVTTNLTGGYLLTSRSNYSADAVLTEMFVLHSDFGVEYLTVQASIDDGGSTQVTSSTFKREPDGSNFSPTGCEIYR